MPIYNLWKLLILLFLLYCSKGLAGDVVIAKVSVAIYKIIMGVVLDIVLIVSIFENVI